MNRRTFLALMGAGAGETIRHRLLADASPTLGFRELRRTSREPASSTVPQQFERHPLPRLPSVSGEQLSLVARPSVADFGRGTADVWTLNGEFPAPTIRVRRGRTARINLENDLTEETILHWHGLNVPERADGHPRLAIDPGSSYAYEFSVVDRAGTYWYHPHTHRRTAAQTYRGLAGLLIVEDEEEAAIELPADEYEIPLILQDKRLGLSSSLSYEPRMAPIS